MCHVICVMSFEPIFLIRLHTEALPNEEAALHGGTTGDECFKQILNLFRFQLRPHRQFSVVIGIQSAPDNFRSRAEVRWAMVTNLNKINNR